MPIIPNIGRKTPKLRAVIALIYTLLILGTVSMVYPFLLMLSGSIKGEADINRMDPIPQFLHSEDMRFARFQEARYGEIQVLSAAYGKKLYKFEQAEIPNVEAGKFRSFVEENIDSFPEHFYYIQEMFFQKRVNPRNFRKFRDELLAECVTVEEFNRRYKGALASWNELAVIYDVPHVKEFSYEGKDPFLRKYLQFKRSVPTGDKALINIDGLYANTQQSYEEIKSGRVKAIPVLSASPPSDPSEKVVWAKFVKIHLNSLFVRLSPEGMRMFRDYLREQYPDGVGAMNSTMDSAYPSFEAVKVSYEELKNGALFTNYTSFITEKCPVEHLRVDTPSTRYREYVGDLYAAAPIVAYDYEVYKEVKRPFIREMITRNYVSVIQYIAIYGRAIYNTVIYIGLAILAALTVNPIAAYALSRFNLKSTYTLLMFFLATMAFPGAVTMIPNFLLLKQLHLLNTFWALVLPTVANGYSIFILKGFFDSIPKEVYESAQIDGASEWIMFWKFTMALSKPILALITLGAFTASYTAFMFALIICPNEKMWTLMVWLYQMQIGAHQSIIYAALVLAAIPTLLVFVFAQNVIMRGIVIPVEK